MRVVRETQMFSFNPTQKKIDSSYYVEGYATIFDTPYTLYESRDGVKFFESIDRSALLNADLSDVIMQYNHAGKVLARNTNGTLGIRPDEKGLFIFADLSKSVAAKELFEEVANGLVTRMSWAFSIIDENYDKKKKTNTILRIGKVYDVSAVSIPANNDTEIVARSYFDTLSKEELNQRKRLLNLKILLEV